MVMHYIVEENIFVIIDYKLLVHQKVILINDCFKINGKQMIKMPNMLNMLDTKIKRGT